VHLLLREHLTLVLQMQQAPLLLAVAASGTWLTCTLQTATGTGVCWRLVVL
jgi:hypothetical protein